MEEDGEVIEVVVEVERGEREMKIIGRPLMCV